jgi:hypothetical protein
MITTILTTNVSLTGSYLQFTEWMAVNFHLFDGLPDVTQVPDFVELESML